MLIIRFVHVRKGLRRYPTFRSVAQPTGPGPSFRYAVMGSQESPHRRYVENVPMGLPSLCLDNIGSKKDTLRIVMGTNRPILVQRYVTRE